MNNLIKVSYENEQSEMTVSERDLHKALEIETPYHKWFPRMCEYGFTDNLDFRTILSKSTVDRPTTDHTLKSEQKNPPCGLN